MYMYQVTFRDWRYGCEARESPLYETEEDCNKFIKALKELPNRNAFSGFHKNKFKLKNFSEKDIDFFKKE